MACGSSYRIDMSPQPHLPSQKNLHRCCYDAGFFTPGCYKNIAMQEGLKSRSPYITTVIASPWKLIAVQTQIISQLQIFFSRPWFFV